MRSRPKTRRTLARWLPTAVMVGILVLAGCGDDDGMTAPPSLDEIKLDLAVGEDTVLTASDEVLQLAFPSADAEREYRVTVASGARSVGASPLRLRVVEGKDFTGFERPASLSRGWRTARVPPEQEGLLVRGQIRDRIRRHLQLNAIQPARRGSGPGGRFDAALLPSSGTPQAGDTLEVKWALDGFQIDCTDPDTLTTVVRAVGDRAAMVQDTTALSAAEGGYSDLDYQNLAQIFDDVIFGADTAYFGSPADIDSNNRVLVLFTPEVNKLTPSGSETVVSGLFNPADLAESGDPDGDGSTAATCAASNEAELLYLLVPDPNGKWGPSIEKARAKTNAKGVSAHEFEHLLSAEERVIKQGRDFSSLEVTWLNEALAHLAEEVVGFRSNDEAVRANLTFGDVTESQVEVEAFNAYHLNNFARGKLYLNNPDSTMALALTDPSDGIESLKMRGFGWLFLRWLGDQEGPSGSGGAVRGSNEEEMFRKLSAGNDGGLQGIENVEAVTGRKWASLIARYSPMPLVDDDGPTGMSDRIKSLTWHLRDVYRNLNQQIPDFFSREYPLQVTNNAFRPDTVDFEVQSATGRYFIFASQGSAPTLVLELSDQGGGAVSSTVRARVSVVRIK